MLKDRIISGEFVFKENSRSLTEIIGAEDNVSSIYPNPASSGTVTVNWNGNQSIVTNIQVVDNFGKTVYEETLADGEGTRNTILDVSRLPGSLFLSGSLPEKI